MLRSLRFFGGGYATSFALARQPSMPLSRSPKRTANFLSHNVSTRTPCQSEAARRVNWTTTAESRRISSSFASSTPERVFNPNTLLFKPDARSEQTKRLMHISNFFNLSQLNQTPVEVTKIVPPEMKIFDHIDEQFNLGDLPGFDKNSLQKTIVVANLHRLITIIPFIMHLIKIGIPEKNIYLSGKYYSDSPEAIAFLKKHTKITIIPSSTPREIGQFEKYCIYDLHTLWTHVSEDISKRGENSAEKIILLDSAGRLVQTMPKKMRLSHTVAAVVQTTAARYKTAINNTVLPIIDLATSAAKILLEPTLIAQTVLEKIGKLLEEHRINTDTVLGVVGNGAIGASITNLLLQLGYTVIVFDENEAAFNGIQNNNLIRVKSLKTLLEDSQCIFGCTGKNILKDIDLDIITKAPFHQYLISASSEDKEFQSLLDWLAFDDKIKPPTHPLEDITYDNVIGGITVVNGGYPVNFNRSQTSVPSEDIELTRGLLFVALVQAVLRARKPIDDGLTINAPSREMLNPALQRAVVEYWKKSQPADRFSEEQLACFEDETWIRNHSGGNYNENNSLTECFTMEQPLHRFSP